MPDWGNTAWADMAGLGSIGLTSPSHSYNPSPPGLIICTFCKPLGEHSARHSIKCRTCPNVSQVVKYEVRFLVRCFVNTKLYLKPVQHLSYFACFSL